MSRRMYDRIAIALGVIASAIAGYLTLVHFEEDLLVCSVVNGCETVQNSEYATIGPVPVALLGLIGAVVMLGLAIARTQLPDQRFLISAALSGMLLMSVLYLAYLTYIELFVIDAICQWCVSFFGVALIWFAFEVWNLRRDLRLDLDLYEDV